jgi:hypothetical protein
MTRPRRPALVILPIVLLAALVTTLVVWLNHDYRQNIDLKGLLDPTGGTAALLPNGRIATDELCVEANPCNQALSSDSAEIFRYDTKAQALEQAQRWGADGYHSYWIAIHFLGDRLSREERLGVGQYLDATNTTSWD